MELNNKKIFIAGLARDCEKRLPNIISLTEELRVYFQESQVVIVENDSKDSTKDLLREWSESSTNIIIDSTDYGTVTISEKSAIDPNPLTGSSRISKMANYRNIYLKYLQNSKTKFDYVLILDIDIIYFSVKGILNAIKNAPSDWGGLFALGNMRYKFCRKLFLPLFYDTYAYLGNDEDINSFKQTKRRRRHLQRKLSIILPLKKYHQCKSSFSGIAIYKANLLTDLKYECIIQNSSHPVALCEHTSFNNEIIKKGYSNYICKELYVEYESYNVKFLTDFLLFNIPSILLRK